MPFIRKKNKTFKWPVVVREPSENDAGVLKKVSLLLFLKD